MLVNWCASCGGGRNFGDQLTPVLLRHFGVAVEWSPPAAAQLVCAGSILSKVPNGWRGIILGTGFIQAGMRKDLRSARALAVRGVLTRAACRLNGPVALGDPGILVPDLIERGPPSGVLVIPHYVDRQLVARHPEAVAVPVTTPVLELARLISGASLVITSSLHALIAADAFGVPHVLERHERVIGGMFKFRDYASALGETVTPFRERLSGRPAMTERQAELRGLFTELTRFAKMPATE